MINSKLGCRKEISIICPVSNNSFQECIQLINERGKILLPLWHASGWNNLLSLVIKCWVHIDPTIMCRGKLVKADTSQMQRQNRLPDFCSLVNGWHLPLLKDPHIIYNECSLGHCSGFRESALILKGKTCLPLLPHPSPPPSKLKITGKDAVWLISFFNLRVQQQTVVKAANLDEQRALCSLKKSVSVFHSLYLPVVLNSGSERALLKTGERFFFRPLSLVWAIKGHLFILLLSQCWQRSLLLSNQSSERNPSTCLPLTPPLTTSTPLLNPIASGSYISAFLVYLLCLSLA